MHMQPLSELSNRKINKLVASELVHTVMHSCMGGGSSVYIRLHQSGDNSRIFNKNYCDNTEDYMPIAIEHEIGIYFDNGKVYAGYNEDLVRYDVEYQSKLDTGRAVCECFLMTKGYV